MGVWARARQGAASSRASRVFFIERNWGLEKRGGKVANGAAGRLVSGGHLNWLNRAGKKEGLTVGVDDFGLGKVRNEISTQDMEGLDGALSYLLKLLADPANQQALTAQGHTAADTKAFADAQRQLSTFNTTQNSDQNASLELTDENIKAGNALWEYIVDVLGTGALMYKETNPKKAKTYAMGTLMKRIRKEKGGGTPGEL